MEFNTLITLRVNSHNVFENSKDTTPEFEHLIKPLGAVKVAK